MMSNKYYKVGNEVWQWLIFHQDKTGGFPPYPGYIDEPGTIATADFLSLLFRPPNIVKGLLKENDEMKVFEKASAAKDFILNSQLSSGSFAPYGDIYGIKDVGFSEATATSIVSLLTYLRAFNNFISENDKKNIENAVRRGIRYLVKTMDKESYMWPTYKGSPDQKNKDYRYFPTVNILTAFNLYVDVFPENSASEKNSIKDVIISIVNEAILPKLKENQYLPFSLLSNSFSSLVNTIIAVDNIFSILIKTNTNMDENQKKSWKDILGKTFKFILESLKQSKHEVMDEDIIMLDFPDIPPKYTATYRRDLTAAYVFSSMLLNEGKRGFLEKTIEKNLSQDIEKYIKEVIEKEIKRMQTSKKWWIEEKRVGEWVPATSATCLFLATLNNQYFRRCGNE